MFHKTVLSGLRDSSGDLIRLRTLTNLRWMAIAGQSGALIAAPAYFGLQLPYGICLAAVGASIIANLVFIMVYPGNKRLSESEALFMLLFDLMQLGVLVAATGGLTNPFALLVLAPVTISANALNLRSTIVVALTAICLVTLLAYFNLPLSRGGDRPLTVPPLFLFGFWLSIIIGIAFLSVYSRRVATEVRAMSDALFAAQMALAREQKLTDIGGVVAAAAHELGTPLATIKLVSTEMIDELNGQGELQDDARLIREQADRCRDILRSMGRAGKDDLQLKQAPLTTVVREAAEPHLARNREVIFSDLPEPGQSRQPNVLRRPEVIHGLRNLVQNAVDFSRHKVWVDVTWDDVEIAVRITDDGAGFPLQVFGRIGDPFVRQRQTKLDATLRKDYEGMGLGLFIAKTLLERTGAELTFANAADPFLSPEERPERCGAVVEVKWPMAAIRAPEGLVVGSNQVNDL
ncbi:MAG: ActS/PrrB/RegB family redox-sensitive histidine kinase [bacterium]